MDTMDEKEQGSDLNLMLDLTSEFETESDRAAAILAAAYLDHLLGDLIAASMVVEPKEVEDLLYQKGNGPLGTFSSKISTAYCLDLLSKDERGDLNLIRKIRNEFAHRLAGISFQTQEVTNRCREMKGAQIGGCPSTPRECFTKAAIRLMVDIILRVRDWQSRKGSAVK